MQLLGRRRYCLPIGRGIVRGRGDGISLSAGFLRRRRHASGSGINLRRRRAQRVTCLRPLRVENRNVLFDGMLTPLLLSLLLPLLGLEPACRDRVLLEDLQRARKPANLIGPGGAPALDAAIALRTAAQPNSEQ